MGDAIVWNTILAATHNDGVIHETEKAEAIKLTHIRSFNFEPFLKPVYSHLDDHFERDFDAYSAILTGNQEEKEATIQTKLIEVLEILPVIGPIYSERFAKSLEGLYLKVFHANSSVFQNFMLPMLTFHLKSSGLK
jgi:hypothetical protein